MITRFARRLTRLGAAAAALFLLHLGSVAYTAGPVFWETSTRSDFLKGDVDNLSIDNDGRLLLGPAMQLVHDTNSPFLWAVLPGADGSLLVGSGNEGKVYRIDRAGKGTVFYDAPELEVHALAAAPGGGLYVGTSPDGKIYKVDAKGTGTPFFDPKDKYIWALAVDSAGNVFAATGDKGVIYKITPDGKGDIFYRTKATHVVSLAFDRGGNLVAGTESPGMVFRIDPQGKAFVLLDSSFREIHALSLDAKGTIYAAAVGAKEPSENRTGPEALGTTTGGATSAGGGGGVPSVSTEVTAISVVDLSSIGASDTKGLRREERRAPKGAVYRIAPDGTTDTVWESPEDLPYDVLVQPDGSLLIGTGNKGKIYQVVVDEPPRVTLLAHAPAQQVTRFLPDSQGIVLTSANPGKVFRLTPQRADNGTYQSEVHDAETIATWGTITWRATVPRGGQLQLFTRSGNSQTPDDTWSPWSEAYTNADGQAVTSPKARFLQWRAVLRGKDSPVLTSVTAAYLQKNVRPRVTSINVYPPGVVFQKPFSTGEAEIAGFEDGADARPQSASAAQSSSVLATAGIGPALGRRIYQKGLQTFVWKAEDDNEDKMEYDVLYRKDTETTWRTLKRGLTDTIFVWDTTSVPNGTYTVRIVASDAPTNPPGTALTGQMDSSTFDVDNTPPTITVTGIRRDAKGVVLLFEVRDDQSAVQRVDYSIDAERWRAIYPKDGISDSRFEQYELRLDNEAQTKSLVIRAMDAMNNVATARGEPPASTK